VGHLKRKLISKAAVKIAKYALPIRKEVKDPMSGFFAFKRPILIHITIDSAGYKILLEIQRFFAKKDHKTVWLICRDNFWGCCHSIGFVILICGIRT
jgi:hypothetical protein